jgi:hypothetical protein
MLRCNIKTYKSLNPAKHSTYHSLDPSKSRQAVPTKGNTVYMRRLDTQDLEKEREKKKDIEQIHFPFLITLLIYIQ